MDAIPVVIPAYRAPDALNRCLAALEAQRGVRCEPFVRDNSEDNILFTAAVNEGLARFCWQAGAEFVMVLNQDAYLHPDCVATLVDYMRANPRCGVACPLQYVDERGTRRVTWGGSLQALPHGVHHCGEFASYTHPADTFWANGAALLLRAETVREAGLWDANMRFIYSDVDFSFTVRARHWKISVVPSALAEHVHSSSAPGDDPGLERIKAQDKLYFVQKWLAGGLYRRLAQEAGALGADDVRAILRKQLAVINPKGRGEPPRR